MARIPETEIERLKSEVSLVRLVEASGVELKRTGKDHLGRCPFHDDRTPSLVVSEAKNLWHCLGACQTGGTVIDWVMRTQGVSFRHAVELLRDDVSLAAPAVPVKHSTVRKLPAPVASDADDHAVLRQVTDYYHDKLKQSPEALAYLESRGLRDASIIERFKLGFANRTLGLRLPAGNRKAGAEVRERLQRLGVIRDSGHEHFNGSLVIPVWDEAGHITELYGRKITPNLRPGTPLHLYLPGPHRGVWNIEAVQSSKEIILCEALIDALTFWCAGYRNVTASYGVEGFTDDHLAAFKRYGIERVLIAYDRDEAGDKAAAKLADRLMNEGIECYRIQFPKGMDANDYALKVQPASKSLGIVIRKALWLGKGAAPARAPEAHIEDVPVAVIEPTSPASDPEPASSLAAEPESAPDPLPASPLPEVPAETPAEIRDGEAVLIFGDRRYRVRGLAKNLSPDTLKVNLLVSRDAAFYVDTLDLYASRARAGYITQAAIELQLTEDIIKTDLGRVLLRLEALQDEQLRKTLEPDAAATVTISAEDQAAALALLQAPNLLDRILSDFEACGVVGETTNKLTGYLATISRKLGAPLAVLVQSSSAAGKSSLMDAVLAFVPEEERIQYSAMTGQSLFYMGETNLKHKILAIAEEEGAHRAAYALKLLQSEGELTIASTGKDPNTGNLITQQYRVEGPVMIFLTTTAIDIDEELLNRCVVLTVDETREQTQAIHRRQRARRTLDGLLARQEREHVLALHRNAQRLLRPLSVVNPHADRLTFLDDRTRTRRDHEKYLTLIDTIALLHQHQRPVKTMSHRGKTIEYIEATLADIGHANRLAHEVLGRSLDELPPQTRTLLGLLCALVAERTQAQAVTRSQFRFSRRDVREASGWGDTQLCVHLERLVVMEYLLVHRGGRGQSFVYELLYDGDGTLSPHLSGLLDVTTMPASRGNEGSVAGPMRAQSGPSAGPVREAKTPGKPDASGVSAEPASPSAKSRVSAANGRASYPQIAVA
ncbi:MAG: DNA primase [Xanthomonadaceae bacterium]|nr:DNA primase [Xanthomonadaceae bacterium]